MQPFLGLTGNSWGSLGEARFEHDFRFRSRWASSWRRWLWRPSGDGPGALAEARVTAAFSTRYLAVGLGVAASCSASVATACR